MVRIYSLAKSQVGMKRGEFKAKWDEAMIMEKDTLGLTLIHTQRYCKCCTSVTTVYTIT